MPCFSILNDDITFVCKSCLLQPHSILCVKCAKFHIGHDLQVSTIIQGFCDCGTACFQNECCSQEKRELINTKIDFDLNFGERTSNMILKNDLVFTQVVFSFCVDNLHKLVKFSNYSSILEKLQFYPLFIEKCKQLSLSETSVVFLTKLSGMCLGMNNIVGVDYYEQILEKINKIMSEITTTNFITKIKLVNAYISICNDFLFFTNKDISSKVQFLFQQLLLNLEIVFFYDDLVAFDPMFVGNVKCCIKFKINLNNIFKNIKFQFTEFNSQSTFLPLDFHFNQQNKNCYTLIQTYFQLRYPDPLSSDYMYRQQICKFLTNNKIECILQSSLKKRQSDDVKIQSDNVKMLIILFDLNQDDMNITDFQYFTQLVSHNKKQVLDLIDKYTINLDQLHYSLQFVSDILDVQQQNSRIQILRQKLKSLTHSAELVITNYIQEYLPESCSNCRQEMQQSFQRIRFQHSNFIKMNLKYDYYLQICPHLCCAQCQSTVCNVCNFNPQYKTNTQLALAIAQKQKLPLDTMMSGFQNQTHDITNFINQQESCSEQLLFQLECSHCKGAIETLMRELQPICISCKGVYHITCLKRLQKQSLCPACRCEIFFSFRIMSVFIIQNKLLKGNTVGKIEDMLQVSTEQYRRGIQNIILGRFSHKKTLEILDSDSDLD